MIKTTTATPTAPVEEPLDAEFLEFRAGFESRSPLDEIVREGAQRMLQAALDAEVGDFIAQHSDRRDDQDRRLVVRNGRLPSREILSGAGPLEMSQPRVRDKSPNAESRIVFSPNVLPPYLKRTHAIEELIPRLTGLLIYCLQSQVALESPFPPRPCVRNGGGGNGAQRVEGERDG